MRALVLAPFHPPTLASLAQLMPVDYESWTKTRRFQDPEELGLRLQKESVTHLIVEADFIFEELFQNAADLRFVGICRAALNHVDLDAATEHDVLVVNTPGRNARAVAELTLGSHALPRPPNFASGRIRQVGTLGRPRGRLRKPSGLGA